MSLLNSAREVERTSSADRTILTTRALQTLSSWWATVWEKAGIRETSTSVRQQQQQVSIASVMGSSVPSSSIPLVRLARAAGRQVKAHRRRYIAAGAVALALIGAARAAQMAQQRRRRRHHQQPSGSTSCSHDSNSAAASRNANGHYGGDDDIVFVDPIQSLFTSHLRTIKQFKEAPFLAVLKELQDLVAARDVPLASASVAGGGVVQGDHEWCEDLRRRINFKARQADELLTQYVVSLDGLPTKGSTELRERRRRLIKEAVAMADQVTPYLPLHKSATADISRAE